MLSEMTRAEKAELLRWIVRDLGDDFPGIESKPNVMGGRALYHADENTRLGSRTCAASAYE